MIVEDEAADATLLKRAFSKLLQELEIDVAEDGGDALDILIAKNQAEVGDISYPTCVLLDLKLRRLDGHEVLKRLKENDQTRSLPIIVFTSSSDPNDVRKAYDLGANSYVVKPVRASEMQDVAKSICEYWLGTNHNYQIKDAA